MSNVEKYYNENDELGVLVSYGFGAGWSTWNNKELAYDKRIVEYWLNEKPSADEMQEFVVSLGYAKPYMGGYRQLDIEYIPRGTMFCIHEYDGAESIRTAEEIAMSIA